MQNNLTKATIFLNLQEGIKRRQNLFADEGRAGGTQANSTNKLKILITKSIEDKLETKLVFFWVAESDPWEARLEN